MPAATGEVLYRLSYLHAWRRAGVEPATLSPDRRGKFYFSKAMETGRTCMGRMTPWLLLYMKMAMRPVRLSTT